MHRWHPDHEEQDDFGQVDGDASADAFRGQAEQFQPTSPGQPWLRASEPPWHMWGTTQTLVAPANLLVSEAASNQLAAVRYKRPESWRWVFSARLLDTPLPGLGQDVNIRVVFDLFVGVGRSNQRLTAFETLQWFWQGPAPAPLDVELRSTQSAGLRSFRNIPPTITRVEPPIDTLAAETIMCSCRVLAEMSGGVPIPQPVTVEVSAHFAPVNHFRPEWFLNAPPEVMFPGDELGGR